MKRDPGQFIAEAGRMRRWLLEQAHALAEVFDADEAAGVLQAVATRCNDALKLRKRRPRSTLDRSVWVNGNTRVPVGSLIPLLARQGVVAREREETAQHTGADPLGYCLTCGLLLEDCECVVFEDTRTRGHADIQQVSAMSHQRQSAKDVLLELADALQVHGDERNSVEELKARCLQTARDWSDCTAPMSKAVDGRHNRIVRKWARLAIVLARELTEDRELKQQDPWNRSRFKVYAEQLASIVEVMGAALSEAEAKELVAWLGGGP